MTVPRWPQFTCVLPAVSLVFCGYHIFGTPPVTSGSLTFIFSGALRFLLIALFSAGAWRCPVFWGSITVLLLIVLFYSFRCYGSLLMRFSFFIVFFIRLSFNCFHLRCLDLPQWFAWALLDKPGFQITVHSHCFESSRNHWRLQGGLYEISYEMEQFCFFRIDEIQVFPARTEHLALYLQHLLDTTHSHSAVHSAQYGIQWAHNSAGIPSPTDNPIIHDVSRAAKRFIGTYFAWYD